MNLTAACVLIAWHSQEKWVCLLTSTWYCLSPSPMSVYLLTWIFCRWFGYNLIAAAWSCPVQPVLQQLSHMAGILSSWILALVDSSVGLKWHGCVCVMWWCNFAAPKQNFYQGREALPRPAHKGHLYLATSPSNTGERELGQGFY